jgi:hypothetical protein
MRDLYRRLNVRPYAPPEEVRQALASFDMEALRPDAERVLLNPRRRQSYDRAHRLLVTVGQLRTRLDLQLRPFWGRSGNQDFTAPRHGGNVNPIRVMQRDNARPTRRPWLAGGLVAALGAAAMGVWVAWKLRH